MRKRSVILCLLVVFLISVVDSKRRGGRRRVSRSNKFDLLIFTQHWPQTVCYLWKENSAAHKCSLPKDDEWTIHGIWPSEYHKLGPQFCNSSLPFNPTALKPLEEELNEKWIDVEVGRGLYSLWKHEWEKHGTCAAVLDRLDTEAKYFQEGLNLLDTYDMKHVLGKAGILPGNRYTAQNILDAIERILGKRGEVICAKNKETRESYVFEIRICFDKTLQLIDCDGISEYPTNCDKSKTIIYPGNVPHDYRVVQI